MSELTTLAKNRYIRAAHSFSSHSGTHVYSTHEASVRVRDQQRRVVVEVFSPQKPERGRVHLALIPGGALTPATNFYDLGPMMMRREPGRHFFFVNTPGTGLSGGKARDFDHLDFAFLDLCVLREAMGEAPIILGGHSQGGGFAQTVARLNTEIDPRKRLNLIGLLLLDPVPLGGAAYIFWKFLKTLGSRRHIVRNIVTSADVDDEMVAFFSWAMNAKKSLSPRALLANTLGRDFPDAKHPVRVPALILGAQDSGTVRQERLREMQCSATYPNARYKMIASEPGETAGHLSYLSYSRTADVIVRFLRELDATAKWL